MKNNFNEIPDKFKVLYEDNYWDKIPIEELEKLTEEFNKWKINLTVIKSSDLLNFSNTDNSIKNN